MAMNEDYCNYELSVALKAAGFDEPCDHYWSKEFANSDEMVLRQASADDYNNDDWYVPHCSAPHIYKAQKWLREKKELIILIGMTRIDDWFYGIYDKCGKCLKDDGTQRESYEVALSAGIASALELIKKGG